MKIIESMPKEIKEEFDNAGSQLGDFILYDGELYVFSGIEEYAPDDEIYHRVVLTSLEDGDTKDTHYKEFLDCLTGTSRYYVKVRGPISGDETIESVKQHYDNLTLQVFSDPGSRYGMSEEVSTETGLIPSGGRGRLESTKQELEEKRREADIVRKMVERRVSQIDSYVSNMNKQITRINRIVGVLELYLGVEEDIIQIQHGTPAPPDLEISVRQLVLYMDEEVGNHEYQNGNGIDWENIEEFDKWLTEDGNWNLVLPEEKGVVAIRPSRQQRWYDGMFGPVFKTHEKDYRLYLLIRNGDNLYRIWTNSNIGDKFFPTRNQMDELLKNLDGWGWDKEKAEDAQLDLSKNAMLLQGLVDRTEIFPSNITIDVRTSEGFNYIYDGEAVLPDGKVTYKEWKAECNNKIERGTRVFISSGLFRTLGSRNQNRFLRYYNEYNVPPYPEEGIHTIEKVLEAEEGVYRNKPKRFIIKYNPKDTVYGNWYQDYHERRNKLSFVLYPDDDFVFNYDLLDLDSINWYIGSRIERSKYLDVMPVLYGLRTQRQEEMKWEEHFVNLVQNKTGESKDNILKAIDWWKNRVIWKRPIMKDDSKALRMIIKHLNGAWSDEYENL